MGELEIRVGSLGLLLSRDDAARVAAQLVKAGVTGQAGVTADCPQSIEAQSRGLAFTPSDAIPDLGRPILDDDPLWSMHSGDAKRYGGPEWEPGDEPRARTLEGRLPRYTAALHQTLVEHSGRLLSVEDLSQLTGGLLSTNRTIAGAVAGYATWCEILERRFPFRWWEGRNGGSASYAMQIKVAKLFLAARREPNS